MTIEELRRQIEARADGRFLLLPSLADQPEEGLAAQAVVQLRPRRDGAGVRTLLLAQLEPGSIDPTPSMRLAARWRQRLGEPESVDLLLLLLAPLFNEYWRRRVEADENFCRKLVARGDEGPADLLDRSFLASASSVVGTAAPEDPVSQAFASVRGRHGWMTPEVQAMWREALLSGESGSDLTIRLHAATPEQP